MDIILRYNYWADRKPLGAVLAYTYKKIGKNVESKLIEATEFRSNSEKELIINNYKNSYSVLNISQALI